MRKKIIILFIMLCRTLLLQAQNKSNFTIQLKGFDSYDKAVVTVQHLDEHADVLKNETELINGNIFPLEGGVGTIKLDQVPNNFILTVNLYSRGTRYGLIANWFVNNTDSIVIEDIDSKRNFDRISINGRGSALYELQYKLDGIVGNRITYPNYPTTLDYFTSDFARSFGYDRAVDMNIEVGRLINETGFDSNCKKWMLTNMFYKIYTAYFLKPLILSFVSNDLERTRAIKDVFNQFKSNYGNGAVPGNMKLSTDYMLFYLLYSKLEATFSEENKVEYQLHKLQTDFKGESLEKMAYAYLSRTFYQVKGADRLNILNWMISITKSPMRLAKLEEMRAIGAGMPFPDFELSDLKGKQWTKNDLLGKVVFFDFYYTGCGNCVTYFKNKVSKAEEHFRKNEDVVFVSVSIDKNFEVWRSSVESEKYNSEHSLKLYTNGEGNNHVLIKNLRINGYPFPILMGKNGLIETSDNVNLGISSSSAETLIKTIEKSLNN